MEPSENFLNAETFARIKAKEDLKIGRMNVKCGDIFVLTTSSMDRQEKQKIQIHRKKNALVNNGFYISIKDAIAFFEFDNG